MSNHNNSTRKGAPPQDETEFRPTVIQQLAVTTIHCHDILNPDLSLAAIGAFAVACALLRYQDTVSFDDVAKAAGITDEFCEMLMDELTDAGYIGDGKLTGRSLIYAPPIPSARGEQYTAKAPQKSSVNGYVYLLKADTGHYKIGRTKNPKDRIKTFSVKLPFRVEYDCLIKSDEYITLEAELHATFADKRIEGEWFALTDDDVAYIRELAEVAS